MVRLEAGNQALFLISALIDLVRIQEVAKGSHCNCKERLFASFNTQIPLKKSTVLILIL